jgi:hypothetical protein
MSGNFVIGRKILLVFIANTIHQTFAILTLIFNFFIFYLLLLGIIIIIIIFFLLAVLAIYQ